MACEVAKKKLQILWQPTEVDLKSSPMSLFKDLAEKSAKTPLPDFASLYSWSISEPKLFWDLVVKFTKINFSTIPSNTLDRAADFWKSAWYPGATLNFTERVLQPAYSRDLADKVAIVSWNEDGDRSELTFRELSAAVASLADSFTNWGIQAGDRVAGLLNNTPHAVIAMLATAKIGAIWTGCSPDFGSSAIRDRFEQVAPKLLIAATSHFDGSGARDKTSNKAKLASCEEKISDLVAALPSLEKLVLLHPSTDVMSKICTLHRVPEVILWEEVKQIHQPARGQLDQHQPYQQLPFDHPLAILYSSGTTGKPKCIVHRAGGVLLEHLKEHILHVGLTEKDTLFYYTSTSWMMWNWLVSGLATGATIVLFDGSPAARDWKILWDLADSERVSVFGTSAKYLSVIEHREVAPVKTHNLANLRTILSTGSPLLEPSFDYIIEKIKSSVQVSSISGGTDLVGCFALGNPLTPVFRGELQGRSLGLAVNVYDSEGNAVTNQQGELVCEAPFPSMPLKFWNDSEDER